MTVGRSVGEAFQLLLSGNVEVYSIAFASLRFALLSTLISSFAGIPVGAVIALSRFRGKRFLNVLLNSLMAVPTVVIGLFVYSLISRSGPFGVLGLLFTPAGIIIGQSLLSFPIIVSLVAGSLATVDEILPETLVPLGASTSRVRATVLRESRIPVLAAVIAGFGRIIGEVGISMMLGGNIRWYTRTLTTAIALETSRGQFELGLALGIILLLVALVINALLHWAVRDE
ncbi:MAG: ABC transporter permease [Spirochaetales bacterium]|nr:ABC transporter permease [Spirochaetales bacterium]